MTDDERAELEADTVCRECGKRESGTIGMCPFKQARGSAQGWSAEARDELCNCCETCLHECKMRS